MSLKQGHGTIANWISHPHPDWTTNNATYAFPETPPSPDGVFFECTKHPDGTIAVVLGDTDKSLVLFQLPLPACGPDGLHIIIAWDNGAVTLYFNGALAQELQ